MTESTLSLVVTRTSFVHYKDKQKIIKKKIKNIRILKKFVLRLHHINNQLKITQMKNITNFIIASIALLNIYDNVLIICILAVVILNFKKILKIIA